MQPTSVLWLAAGFVIGLIGGGYLIQQTFKNSHRLSADAMLVRCIGGLVLLTSGTACALVLAWR
jgi:hypothetical protein